MDLLSKQYELIKQRRDTLFQYCETLKPEHFIHNHDSFGGRSINYLFVHIANTYIFWIGHFPKITDKAFEDAASYKTIDTIKPLFKQVDRTVEDFLRSCNNNFEQPLTNKIGSINLEPTLSGLQLFTHVITHEYHHKGQILSMSRQLGYTPIDTDLIRFE